MDSLLSVEDCVKTLHNYLQDTSVQYVNHKIVPISEDAEGFMGEHYRLQITYLQNDEEKIARLFIKTKPTKNKFQAEIANMSPIYIKEIFLYDFLCKEFNKYGYDTSFASKIYYNIPNQTLILDDLNELDYKLHSRNEDFSLVKIKSLLKSLALYHGAGFAYEKSKSKELGKDYCLGIEHPEEFSEIFFHLYLNPDIDRSYWDGNYSLINKLINILPRDEQYKTEFKQMIKDAHFCKTFVEEHNVPKTCGHGDLWSNNMMFKEENGELKCVLVDFQITRYNSPVIDVILAIYSNTSTEFRKEHLKSLYEYYYETLATILKDYGYQISDILSLEDYYKSIAIFRHEALIQVMTTNAIIYMPKNVLTGSVKDDDSFSKVFFNKDDISINAFQNDEHYRKVMIDNLSDLYDSLVEKFRK